MLLSPTSVTWLIAVPSCLCFSALQGALCAGGRVRRGLSVSLGLASLVIPFMIEVGPVLRAAVALHLLWACLKVIGLSRERQPRPLSFRVLQVLVLHDLRRDAYVQRGPHPELRLDLLVSGAIAIAVALGALWVSLFSAPQLSEPWRWCVRHLAALVFAYFGVEGSLRSFELIYRGLGLAPPILHAHPILSRSVAEFWGRRWNRIVGSWLFANFYRPLALSGRRRAGALSAFAASAALHFYFTWASIGLSWGLMMAAFFVLQVPLVWLEERFGEKRWPRLLQHVWTLAVIVATSPLFIEPLLAILQGGFAP